MIDPQKSVETHDCSLKSVEKLESFFNVDNKLQ